MCSPFLSNKFLQGIAFFKSRKANRKYNKKQLRRALLMITMEEYASYFFGMTLPDISLIQQISSLKKIQVPKVSQTKVETRTRAINEL